MNSENHVWVVNSSGDIFRYQGGSWYEVPGKTTDIGVGTRGGIWITGKDKVTGGYGIFRWNGKGWDKVNGGALNIALQ